MDATVLSNEVLDGYDGGVVLVTEAASTLYEYTFGHVEKPSGGENGVTELVKRRKRESGGEWEEIDRSVTSTVREAMDERGYDVQSQYHHTPRGFISKTGKECR